MPNQTLMERFMGRVSQEPMSGCWLWSGKVDRHGYGQLMVNGEPDRMAHRVSWTLHNGEIGDMKVLHRCDNTACVNPRHLFLGTHQNNMDDMWSKRRGVLPPARPLGRMKTKMDRLTHLKVLAIRTLGNNGQFTQQELAEIFGISIFSIRRVARYATWRTPSL